MSPTIQKLLPSFYQTDARYPPLNSIPSAGQSHGQIGACVYMYTVSKWHFLNRSVFNWLTWVVLLCKRSDLARTKAAFPHALINNKWFSYCQLFWHQCTYPEQAFCQVFIINLYAWVYLSPISQHSLISDIDLSPSPWHCRVFPFMAVKYLQGNPWITKHRAGNSTLCSQHANPLPSLPSFPAWWIYCALFASLCLLVLGDVSQI